jgi:predicted transcriptional regulator
MQYALAHILGSMNVLQCRMARAGLSWSIAKLAETARIAPRTVAKFENGGNVLPDIVERLRQTFVASGVEFINGGKSVGVRVPRLD